VLMHFLPFSPFISISATPYHFLSGISLDIGWLNLLVSFLCISWPLELPGACEL
jgi:hypothetical protein